MADLVPQQNDGENPSKVENTLYALPSDVVYFQGGETLTDKEMFSNATQLPGAYRPYQITITSLQKKLKIKAISASHVMKFAARNTSEPLDVIQKFFEEFSKLGIKNRMVAYDDIPMHLLLPYFSYYNGLTPAVSFLAKSQNWFEFADPLVVPYGGDIILTFKAAPGLTLATAGNTNPTLPTVSGLTNSQAFWMNFQFIAEMVRYTA